jgi:hypothetical protein
VIENSINAIRQDLVGQVQVTSVSQTDGIDTTGNQSVSICSFDVKIAGKALNFLSQTDIDPTRLIEELNYQSPDNVITLSNGVYSRNYFFTLFSKIQISRQKYSKLVTSIQNVFLSQYPQFSNFSVTASIPLQEEYIDLSRNVIYGLNILITINKQPVDDIISLNRNIFNQIQIDDNVANTFFVPSGFVMSLSKATTIYSNMAITKNNIPKLEILVQNMFETTLPSYKDELSVILASQKAFIAKDGTKYWKLFIITNVKNTGNVLSFTQSNSEFVSKLSELINFVHPSGIAYKIYNNNLQGLYDFSMQFSVVIKGKVAQYDRETIRDAVKVTWNSSVQQSIILNDEWSKGMYEFIFIDNENQLIDLENQYYTKFVYFMKRIKNLVSNEDFDVLPKYEWIEGNIKKKNLPYRLADPDSKNLRDYETLYFVDFAGYIDFTQYDAISKVIKSEFMEFYTGNYSPDYPKMRIL